MVDGNLLAVLGLEADFDERVKRAVGRMMCVRNVEKTFPGFWTGTVTMGSGWTTLVITGSSVNGDGEGVMISLM